MVLTLQLSYIYQGLATFFHRFMSPPPSCVPGLFIRSEYRVETRPWHDILRDDANSCKLVCIEFCKAKDEKLHEFLVLYFSHPTHTTARAVVVVDRAVKDRSRFSAIASPSSASQTPTEALDIVYIVGQGDSLHAYLAKLYTQYDKLCVLRYTGPLVPQAPSAIQLSTLLLVATNHRPNYQLYEYNCYWYANTIFEACKTFFPGSREECLKHAERGQCCLNIPMLAKNSIPDIRNEYNIEWERVERRRKANQEIGVAQQDLERRLDEERKDRETAQRQLEEEHRILEATQLELEEERRARDAAQLARLELERRLEEAQRRCEQLQAVR